MTGLDQLIAECVATLPVELASALNTPANPAAAALAHLIARARHNAISTLPYARLSSGVISWVSFGGDSRALMEYAEDLRAWILPGYGTQGDLEFARGTSQGRLAGLVQSVSPAGYLRWESDAASLAPILDILNQLHTLLASMPAQESTAPHSLHVLRFRFVSALRCGEWEDAEQVINEIDRWNLEQAHKTMQMRLRVLGESRNHAALLAMVEKQHLWSLTHPTRVAEAIVEAVLKEVVRPLEFSLPHETVCEHLRPWQQKLAAVLPMVKPEGPCATVFAYRACLDQDAAGAYALLPYLSESLAAWVCERFPAVPDPSEVLVPPVEDRGIQVVGAVTGIAAEDKPGYWNTLLALVRQGSSTALDRHLSELDARVGSDPALLDAVPDLLLELISDPAVESSTVCRNALQELLTVLVDVVFSGSGFPNPRHCDLYLSVTEALVYMRGASASEEDAHLLHGLLAAIANLSTATLPRCTALLKTWWDLRPIVPRLEWLLAVLDSLAPLHPNPSSLVDLWAKAVDLVTRRQVVLSPSQFRLWQRVAGMLELDAQAVGQDLAKLCPPPQTAPRETPGDILSTVPWKKIAIISLQENAAREAARELESRTHAEVTVVTSKVQDGIAKAAKTADVILMVWAASSHAVYRAFDECRSRVAYVQGTGSSSIVATAERWAEKHRTT